MRPAAIKSVQANTADTFRFLSLFGVPACYIAPEIIKIN